MMLSKAKLISTSISSSHRMWSIIKTQLLWINLKVIGTIQMKVKTMNVGFGPDSCHQALISLLCRILLMQLKTKGRLILENSIKLWLVQGLMIWIRILLMQHQLQMNKNRNLYLAIGSRMTIFLLKYVLHLTSSK